MPNEQQGFTLIELMIVVAIIGTLAALAVPAYQDYTIRAQITDGLKLSAGAKVAVSEYYMDSGDWPNNNNQANLANQNDITGKYTNRLRVNGNVIVITYGNDAHNAISNQRVELTAVDNAGSISWTCASAGNIQANHLPAACR